jgi:hypothetical protein
MYCGGEGGGSGGDGGPACEYTSERKVSLLRAIMS